MKVKVSEASGPVLDWMVAKCEGHEATIDGYGCIIRRSNVIDRFEPSTNWGWGGPIIEREMRERGFDVWRTEAMQECAATYERGLPDSYVFGPTPLVAAMRCFVASKLGDEVEVPGELV